MRDTWPSALWGIEPRQQPGGAYAVETRIAEPTDARLHEHRIDAEAARARDVGDDLVAQHDDALLVRDRAAAQSRREDGRVGFAEPNEAQTARRIAQLQDRLDHGR